MNVEFLFFFQVAEKGHSVFEGFKRGPFEHTKTFVRKLFLIFFFNVYEKCISFQFQIFSQKYACIKKKNFFTASSSNCSVSSKFCPMLVETP